jgi:hypothetical protein
MNTNRIDFRVSQLSATVPEGVPIRWQGKEFASGPLSIELDSAHESRGALDYSSGRAAAEFHVRLSFPELASLLEDAGVDPELTRPVFAVLRSEGDILPDHSFAFSGVCRLSAHELFPPDESRARVLPGR